MKIYLASWLYEPAQGRAMTRVSCVHRLLSYFHTRDREEDLERYVRTGKNKRRKK